MTTMPVVGQTIRFQIGREYPVMTAIVEEVSDEEDVAYILTDECAARYPHQPKRGWVDAPLILEIK